MKKFTVVLYIVVSAIAAFEAVAALYAFDSREPVWALIAVCGVISGVIAFILGGKVFKDLTSEADEDYDE